MNASTTTIAPPPTTLIDDCDFCIVGTGAAGGLLAYRLVQAGFSVVSLEQGSSINDRYFTNEQASDEQKNFGIPPEMPWPVGVSDGYLYSNDEAFRLYADARTTSTSADAAKVFTNRQIFRLNGKLNLWNGVVPRYAARDFRGRDFGDSDVNWPIGYGDLERHYTEVERIIGVCGTRDGLDNMPDGEFLPPLPLRPADKLIAEAVKKLKLGVEAISNRKAIETRRDRPNVCRECGECIYGCSSGSMYKFSSHLLPKIAGRDNFRILYDTKVARLVRAAGSGRIESAECLNTQTRQPFLVKAKAFIVCAGALETPRILFNSRDEASPTGLANQSGTLGCYLQDKVKVMVGSSLLKLAGSRTKYSAGYSDNLLIPRFLFDNQEFRGGYLTQVCHLLPKRPYYLAGLAPFPRWSRKWLAKWLFRTFVALLLQGKPETRKTNRVVPSKSRDEYGVPQVDVEYRFTQRDDKMRESMVVWGTRILRKSSGLFMSTLADHLPGESIHYAGTCRMAPQGDDGVVDPNLKTFEHDNLYLCDGSVFPETSEKNLTLTIMALADRLGEHLTARYTKRPTVAHR